MTDHRDTPAQPSATPRSRRRFALTGRSHAFDPRVDAARGDLADIRLADRLFAPHYAAAVTRSVARRTPVLAAIAGEPVSEVLRGETFDVLELSQGYAWGVGGVDGAVGFVAADALTATFDVSHVVTAAGGAEPIGTRISEVAGSNEATSLDGMIGDTASLAEALLGTSYVKGGRSGAGIDAAGLVSLVLSLAGIRAPRFADLQAEQVGHPVSADSPVLRGDLLFRGDHAGIAVDDVTMITVVDDAVARLAIASFAPEVRRRLP